MKCGLPGSILCGMIITHKQTTLIPPTIHNRLPDGSLVFDDQNVQQYDCSCAQCGKAYSVYVKGGQVVQYRENSSDLPG